MYVLSRTSALVLHALRNAFLVAAAVISSARERIRGSRRDPRSARPPAPAGRKVEGVSRPVVRTHTSKSHLQQCADEASLCKGSRFGGGPVAGGRVCEGWVKVDAYKVPSTPRVKI